MEIAGVGFVGLVVLAFAALFGLAIWLIVRAHRRAEQRRRTFAVRAHQRGWTYVPRDDQWNHRFTGSPFGLGHNQQSHNILAGQFEGRGFVAFDYVYYTTESSTDSEGRSSSREVAHPYTVVALNTGAAFPPLAVSPEGVLSRVLGRFGAGDVDLESEDFNRAFVVSCPSPRFASDLLHPQMMELLLTQPTFAFRFDGASILAIRAGQAEIPEIETRLLLLDAIVDRIPEFVWRNVMGH